MHETVPLRGTSVSVREQERGITGSDRRTAFGRHHPGTELKQGAAQADFHPDRF